MKTKILFLSFLSMFIIGSWITPQQASAAVAVTAQVFYDDLSPYGTWVDSPYGYVWMPDAGSDFVPYSTNGNWVYTDAGWTWVSSYPWGWAPFHYGRWYTDLTYGPVWFPGYTWSPGWVTWRSSNDYYGWAPMEPGVSMHDAYAPGYCPHHNRWTGKRNKDFGRENTPTYYYNNTNNGMIVNNSTVINNVYIDKSHNSKYHGGPYKMDVEKHTGKTITPYTIYDKSGPGQNLSKNQMQLYRPDVKNNFSSNKSAPTKAIGYKDTKTFAQRNTKSPTQASYQQSKQSSSPFKQSFPTKKDNVVKQPAQYSTSKKDNTPKQSVQYAPTKRTVGVTPARQTTPTQKTQGTRQTKQTNTSKKGKD